MRTNFTRAEEEYIQTQYPLAHTVYEFADAFNAEFPNHQTNYINLQKKASSLGVHKGTRNIRKEMVKHKNGIGTIIVSKGHSARIKTENGYVPANQYFKNLLYPNQQGRLLHLNGNCADFSEDNLVLVSKSIYKMLYWRNWVFEDKELTKTALLTAQLLELFPTLRHNENQYLRIKRN